MEANILFGVMSATQPASMVDQLAELLYPHTIVVHHDFRKLPSYAPTAPNVVLVPDPRETGWGSWGLAEAVFHTMRFALDRFDFDYFQLLSPTCLPIRPISEFEEHVARSSVDAHVDLLHLDEHVDTLMHYAYRTYMPAGTLRFRALRRLRGWYFGGDQELEQLSSLSRLKGPHAQARQPLPPRARFALAVTRAAARGWLGSHPFVEQCRAVVGGLFFGARRPVCDYLVGMSGRGVIPPFMQQLQIVDETVFPVLLANSRFRLGPSNHAINDFSIEGNPRWIEEADLDRLVSTGRFFARKFPVQLDARVRRRALRMLAQPAHA